MASWASRCSGQQTYVHSTPWGGVTLLVMWLTSMAGIRIACSQVDNRITAPPAETSSERHVAQVHPLSPGWTAIFLKPTETGLGTGTATLGWGFHSRSCVSCLLSRVRERRSMGSQDISLRLGLRPDETEWTFRDIRTSLPATANAKGGDHPPGHNFNCLSIWTSPRGKLQRVVTKSSIRRPV